MPDETTTTTPNPSKMVEVKWGEPGPAVYANNLCIQFDGASIHLTFAQMNPPLVIGTTEQEIKTGFEKISSIAATPIVRLVIPFDAFRAMFRVIRDNMEKIEKISKS
jgi:hypothetical protein